MTIIFELVLLVVASGAFLWWRRSNEIIAFDTFALSILALLLFIIFQNFELSDTRQFMVVMGAAIVGGVIRRRVVRGSTEDIQ